MTPVALMRPLVVVLLCWLCACSSVTVVRYRPSAASNSTAVVDHGPSTLAVPARGEATSANLSDGFPVWVVHHRDGTITVVSAVAPPRPRRHVGDDVAGQVDRNLVSWIPGVGRFYGSGILFDDQGHALGYAEYDMCLDACPRIEDMPPIVHDLDTFAIRPQPDSTVVAVGQLVAGQPRRRAPTWLPWRRPANREEDMRSAFAPALLRRSLHDALTLADGHYAVIDADAVRSTDAEPVICTATHQGATCGVCSGERLPLAGIAASDAAHIHSDGWWKDPGEYRRSRGAVYVEAEQGTFLVRRERTGFQIVAGIFRGICSE